MNYYKIEGTKVEITNSNYELQGGWVEYTVGEEPQIVAEYLAMQSNRVEKIAEVLKSKAYLADTDWYFIRKLDTGASIPEDVITKRAEAREFIRANENSN